MKTKATPCCLRMSFGYFDIITESPIIHKRPPSNRLLDGLYFSEREVSWVVTALFHPNGIMLSPVIKQNQTKKCIFISLNDNTLKINLQFFRSMMVVFGRFCD